MWFCDLKIVADCWPERWRSQHKFFTHVIRQIFWLISHSCSKPIFQVWEEFSSQNISCTITDPQREYCGYKSLHWNARVIRVFRRVRKIAKSIISFRSTCPSVRMELGSLWTDFHKTLILEYFSKICRENSSFIKIWHEPRILYMQTNIRFWSSLAQFLQWEIQL
jgi:hypothetical protein